MARGTVVGEQVVSQANTKAFEEGYERAGLGTSESSRERGRFVWDEKLQKMVRPHERSDPEFAKNAPILSGRFYENCAATDGTDIGSRAKHREYMQRKGLTVASDYTQHIAKKQKERAEFLKTGRDPKRVELLKREIRRVIDMPQARYDRERSEREKARAARGTYSET